MLDQRFWDKVNKTNKCWEWNAAKNRKGYGQHRINGVMFITHRLVAQYVLKKRISGKLVCHTCDNPSCVRPDHLVVGDAFFNMQDMARKGRSAGQKKTVCKRAGHPLSGDNLYIDPRGYRECRECRRQAVRRKRMLGGR